MLRADGVRVSRSSVLRALASSRSAGILLG